jgi:hypothetical protein
LGAVLVRVLPESRPPEAVELEAPVGEPKSGAVTAERAMARMLRSEAAWARAAALLSLDGVTRILRLVPVVFVAGVVVPG